jgi:myo-inositol 2-dehydrogenase / D-chiro-inositol 1-dehydrogenase
MIGLALLGAGRMAKVHAEAISAAGARLLTVFDVAEAAAASLASKAGASVARTAEEALSHPEITAVLVATSSDTHVKYVIDAVHAGKAVMCEKPLCRQFTLQKPRERLFD